MTRESIRDFIPWDEIEECRDIPKDNNKVVFTDSKRITTHHTKIDSTGEISKSVDKLQGDLTKLNFVLDGIRDEIDELEAREIQNVLTKQSKRE